MKNFFYLTFVILMAAGLYSCGNQAMADNQSSDSAQATEKSTETAAENAPEVASAIETKVKITTSYGEIVVKLYNETVQHRDNFIKLTDSGFFNKTLFHRVIQNFMIQGGDPTSIGAPAGAMLGNGGPGYTIPAEFMPEKYFHKRGALAAAREGDQVNPEKASSGSQFYIVQGQVFTDSIINLMESYYRKTFTPAQREAYRTIGGAPHLDGEYTVFGEVVSGMEVIERIAAQPVDRNSRPIKDIPMQVEIIK